MKKRIEIIIKRIFDILASLIGLIIFLPIIIAAGILIKINLGNPIFFKQKRIGKDNREFKIIKFRTMNDEKDYKGNPLPDEARLTPLGKKIRDLSIDELPQLINILKGDMSLIGPRPLLPIYLPLYNKRQIRRHEVIPGITGWAQVNGRNAISWGRKLEFDVWYVENWNLWLDIKIFFITIYKILKREGISQEGVATTEKFNGKN